MVDTATFSRLLLKCPHLRHPSILLLILPNPLCAHFATHVARTLNPSLKRQISKMKEAANADKLEHPQACRVRNGVQANNSVSAVATSTSTSTAATSTNTARARPTLHSATLQACSLSTLHTAPHAPKDVLERARSQDSMRLATLLDALLLR
ncbi:hypothetical protein C8J57DRAFT_1620624 [Mycena rebaudengoi]|nr:hypothetical protein C8J57DRAFT_1620624 [Mycena rebaudengoi]